MRVCAPPCGGADSGTFFHVCEAVPVTPFCQEGIVQILLIPPPLPPELPSVEPDHAFSTARVNVFFSTRLVLPTARTLGSDAEKATSTCPKGDPTFTALKN